MGIEVGVYGMFVLIVCILAGMNVLVALGLVALTSLF